MRGLHGQRERDRGKKVSVTEGGVNAPSLDGPYAAMGTTQRGKGEKRWAVAPPKQKTWKGRETKYRTGRLRFFLGIKPEQFLGADSFRRKTRKVFNATSEVRKQLSPEGRFKHWRRET